MRALLAWLQFWLQLSAFAVVRKCLPSFKRAGRAAYGTVANRPERDHDGLAVWGSGVRVPSAPPFDQAVLPLGGRPESSEVPAWWPPVPSNASSVPQRL